MNNDDFIGSISLFAGNFAPRGFMDCAGQTLPIQQWQALFALIGTYYGGNGTTNFCLPDLRDKDGAGHPIPYDGSKPRHCICVQGVFPSRD